MLAARPVRALALANLALAALAPAPLAAQTRDLTPADSALVGRILLAEIRHDAADPALAAGARHSDGRIAVIARRADGRIRDSLFAARELLPALPAPPAWPEPGWIARYRALSGRNDDCARIEAALADTAWPVRRRAADLVTPACARHDAIAATLARWIDSMPDDVTRRARGGVSWHGAAHALVALARLRPAAAGPRVRALAGHSAPHLRKYAARAAAIVADTAVLRSLARDPDPNVRETAIGELASLTAHADDSLFVAALASDDAQVVRAAAVALTGSPEPAARDSAGAAFERWVARGSDTEKDVRLALLDAAGRPPADDRPPPSRATLPPRATALALGADVRLRVTMAESSGGGSFVVRMRGDVAPVMAARVVELAGSGYYDGLTWHRVDPDFVIQGGSPAANEYVGVARYFRDELGTVPHARGTVGMSTRGHDTGDAQWFVNLKDNLRLGRAFTLFAEVVEGMDVVDAVLEGDVIESIREITPAAPQPRDPDSPARTHPHRP